MSTTSVDSWAVDLADVTTIYPLVGLEGVMAIIGIVLWLGWHVWQIRFESNEYEADIQRFGDAETIRKAIEEGN